MKLNSVVDNSVELFFGVRSISPKIAFLFVTFSLAKQRKSKIMQDRDYTTLIILICEDFNCISGMGQNKLQCLLPALRCPTS